MFNGRTVNNKINNHLHVRSLRIVYKVEAVFPASGNGFSTKCYSFRQVETNFLFDFLLFKANFVLVETIIQIKVKRFLIE